MNIRCIFFNRQDSPDDPWGIFTNSETGEVTAFRHLPPGAMYYAPDTYLLGDQSPEFLALPAEERAKGMLRVKTPGGWWNIDKKATGAESGWSRVGTPPKITASPSINIPNNYHGWLREGELIPC